MQRRQVAVALDSSRFATRADGDTRLPICLSSEAPYERWWGTEILGHDSGEVDLGYCERGLAFCADHDTERQVGVLEEVTVDDDGCIRGLLRFGAHPDAAWIEADMRSGVRPYVSIGYRINAMKLTETDENQNDTYRVTNWTLFEGSSVAVPADVSVGVGRASDLADFPLAIERQAPRKGKEQEDHMPEARAEAAPAPAAALNADEIRGAETNRANDILQLAQENDVPLGEAQRMIRDGVSADAAGRQILAFKRAGGAGRPAPVISGVHDRGTDRPFANFGEQLRAVVTAGMPGGTLDARLQRAATGAGEGAASDGGFLIAPTFASEIFKRAYELGQVLSRVRKFPIGPNSNGVKIPGVDETSRANGSRWGGVRTYWADEGDTVTATKPKFRMIDLNLKKLMGIFYATDEIVQDSTALASIATEAFSEELTFTAEDAVFNGLGAGQPLGFMNSGALVTVSKEAGPQAANTVVAANVAKMRSRLWPRSRANAVWFITPDVEAQLDVMTVGNQPVYLPPGGLSGNRYGMLYGMPVIPAEYCAALSALGDIVLTDLSQYGVIDRSIEQASSMHVRFVYDEMTFRFTYRIDGAPLWNAALTPKAGSTLSPFITLEAR